MLRKQGEFKANKEKKDFWHNVKAYAYILCVLFGTYFFLYYIGVVGWQSTLDPVEEHYKSQSWFKK